MVTLYMDDVQRTHIHFLINDPNIANRPDEVQYYLDWISDCGNKKLGNCDAVPSGHPHE